MKRTQPRRISKKALAANGNKIPFSTAKKKKRSKSEFNRIYGSKERVEFVKSLPCAACGVVGYSENAHVAPASEKGTGYKAGWEWIAPLCGDRYGLLGCHSLFDSGCTLPDFDPTLAAQKCEEQWQEHTEATK